MNLSFIESVEQPSSAPRLNRSSGARTSIRKNLTKKMFVNNITQQIYDIRRKELRLKQREMILNAKENELLQKEEMLLERERALIQREMNQTEYKTVLDSTYCSLGSTISPRTRSITFDQLDTIESELESNDDSENQIKALKSKKKTKLFSFFSFKKSKGKTRSKVDKIVRDILVSDEQDTWINALEILSKMGSKDTTRKSFHSHKG
ncbi:hypothetical protein ACFFRR_003774 [Megaselia abdita]